MHPFDKNALQHLSLTARRQFLTNSAGGVGLAALASLIGRDSQANETPAVGRGVPPLPGLPHHAPKAKRVVLLWQGGGPSHVDLFDDKPALRKLTGQDIPDSVRGTTRLSTMSSGYAKWPCVPAIKPHKRRLLRSRFVPC